MSASSTSIGRALNWLVFRSSAWTSLKQKVVKAGHNFNHNVQRSSCRGMMTYQYQIISNPIVLSKSGTSAGYFKENYRYWCWGFSRPDKLTKLKAPRCLSPGEGHPKVSCTRLDSWQQVERTWCKSRSVWHALLFDSSNIIISALTRSPVLGNLFSW